MRLRIETRYQVLGTFDPRGADVRIPMRTKLFIDGEPILRDELRRLIARGQVFDVIDCQGDWPDDLLVHRYPKGYVLTAMHDVERVEV